jgi:hypothetical protein
MAVSFQNDIVPMFQGLKGQMMWRFDLTNYDHVSKNAKLIYKRLLDPDAPMPPPPMDPLTPEQVQLFERWMTDGCQP